MIIKAWEQIAAFGGIWNITVTPNIFALATAFLKRSVFLSGILHLDTSGHYHSA